MNQNDTQPKNRMRMWLTILVVFAVGIAIGFFFQGEGRIATGSSLLFLLLLTCPLIMVFMMHGSRNGSTKDDEKK